MTSFKQTTAATVALLMGLLALGASYSGTVAASGAMCALTSEASHALAEPGAQPGLQYPGTKVYALLTKLPGMSLEEFSDHWRDPHGTLTKKLPYFKRYVQNHSLAPLGTVDGFTPIPYDGIPSVWVKDLADLQKAFEDPRYLPLDADVDKLYIRDETVWIQGQEYTWCRAPESGFNDLAKAMLFLKGDDAENFSEQLTDFLAIIQKKVSGAVEISTLIPFSDAPAPYDAVVEILFDSLASYQSAWKKNGKTVAAAAGKFADMSQSGSFLARGELVVASENVPAGNWPSYGRDYKEQRFSPLVDVNTDTVKDLALAWHFEFDTNRGQEGTPLVIDGVMYASSAWSKVWALDARNGKLLWSYDPKVPGKYGANACCDVVNRGLAYNKGKIFATTLDGRLQALDAKTGELLWSTTTVDNSKPYTITGAPRVAKGKVFIGNGGADFGVRGYVSAYDENTGELAWRFYTVPGDPEQPDNAASDDVLESMARPTWYGSKYLILGGGGTVWDSIVYDPEMDQLYIGVGNGSPLTRKARSEDKGDNLFLSTIVALDPDTGNYIWHYQEVPGETWDFTATQQITLATLNIDGLATKVLMHAPKNGFFYVVDRSTGKLISAEKYAPANWAERIDMETGRPVVAEGARYEDAPFIATVGGVGAHNWQPMSYSPQTGLMYIPVMQVGAYYNHEPGFKIRPGQWNLGYDMMTTKLPKEESVRRDMTESLKGWISAWNPLTQQEAWRVDRKGPWNGGILSTAGNLVFQGAEDQTFSAYNATTGEALWQFDAGTSILAGPISYAADGEQYVTVLAGNGGAVPLSLPSFTGAKRWPNGKILTFKINGRGEPLPEHDSSVRPVNAPEQAQDAEVVERGRILYGVNCATCHGLGTWSTGVLPDLRRSGVLGSADAWRAIVMDGALEARGMIGHKSVLSEAESNTIRAYIISEAQDLAASEAASASAK